jgi:ribosomal peptide maturation radical SAM protein 1
LESARGCWWGAKHHCTFCGLNGATITWRSKSPARVHAELQDQARRYGSFSFSAVDNILDMGYTRTLMPKLAAAEAGYELFYEVKANLSREQVRALALGGVRQVQPGIESLSSHVLRLMRKGATAAQNVNVLRWLLYYGISASWNVLWGFPGETEQDYAEQVAAVPHLVHLQPPESCGRVWLERFSPMFTEPGVLPTRVRSPEASYRYVYPAGVDLQRAAYFFDYETGSTLPESSYAALVDAVTAWRAAWSREERPQLLFRACDGLVQIYDSRQPGQGGTYMYQGVLADLYVACSQRPVTVPALRERLSPRLSERAIEEVLADWQTRGLVVRDGHAALALALPAGAPR